MSMSLYNDHHKMWLACEDIVCGEQCYAYKFLCQCLINNSTVQLHTEFPLVVGDGFFNQEMVKYSNFLITKYLMKWFHCFDTGLTNIFG